MTWIPDVAKAFAVAKHALLWATCLTVAKTPGFSKMQQKKRYL
jgi:hypothetical protein